MCRRCVPDLTHATRAVELAGDLTFWREQTPIELQFGDIPRVAADINDAEVAIAEGARGAVKALVVGLVADALKAIKAKDVRAASSLEADATDVEAAIKSGTGKAIEAGKRQVFDAYRKQTGSKLALPPRKRPRLTAQYLAAKAAIHAAQVAAQARAAAQKAAISQIAREVVDADVLESLIATAAQKSLLESAVEAAREGVAVGRTTAINDTADKIETLVYTAILDSNVCEECENRDGDEYGPDESGQAPNPDCTGEVYGNVCRCAEVVIYAKEG